MAEDVIVFAVVDFAARTIDGAIGMAHGLSATGVLLALGASPATASATPGPLDPLPRASRRPRDGHPAAATVGPPGSGRADAGSPARQLGRCGWKAAISPGRRSILSTSPACSSSACTIWRAYSSGITDAPSTSPRSSR